MTPAPRSIEQFPGFKRIRVEGAPFERGYQHGQLLRDDIQRLRRTFYDDVVDFHGKPAGLLLQAVMMPFLFAMRRHIPAELRLEMRGVARGAGIRFWDVLIFNCFDDLLHALWLIPAMLERVPLLRHRFACSSFAVLGSNTASDQLVHGRNLDYEVVNGYLAADGAVTKALKEHLVVVEYRPSQGHPFVTIGWPGVVGAVTGLNAATLSLACLTSALNGETPNGLPLPLLYRQILQYCSDLEQTELLIRATRRTIGNNLLVASGRDDDARVFELAPGFVYRRRPHQGVLVTTNHYAHEHAVPHQQGWVTQGSIDRHVRLEELCRAGVHTAQQATEFLRDTHSADPEGDHWNCIENPGTVYSSVAEPSTGRFWLRANDRPDRDFVALEAGWATRRAEAAA